MNPDNQNAESSWSPPPPPDPALWNQQVGATTVNLTEAASQNKTLAIVSLVSGLIGIIFLGILLGPISIVTGVIALKKNKENPTEYGGRGMAISGLALGIIAFIFNAVVFSFMLWGNWLR